MWEKVQKAQGAVFIILLIAAITLITVWIAKNSSNPFQSTSQIQNILADRNNDQPKNTPTQSLSQIEQSLAERT